MPSQYLLSGILRTAALSAGARQRGASARGISAIATTSEIASRPPGLSTRNASLKTRPLSGTYAQYLQKNAETASQLSSMISALFEYEKSMTDIEKLKSKLTASEN